MEGQTVFAGSPPRTNFAEYSQTYSEFLAMTRRDGIIEARIHENGGPASMSMTAYDAWLQAWQAIGNDPENQVVIITGSGDTWLTHASHPNASWREGPPQDRAMVISNVLRLTENVVFSIDVPTIAAINGPGVGWHMQFPLVCDLTICTDDTVFFEGHFEKGVAPGDGFGLVLQELLGVKRSAYYMYTCAPIDAKGALSLGLVNEVVPRENLLIRAWQLAEMIIQQPVNARRATHAIVSRPWKKRLVEDQQFHIAHELLALQFDSVESKASTAEASKS